MYCAECGGKATCIEDTDKWTKWVCASPKNSKCRNWEKLVIKK
jgi:putative hemolysin